MAVRLSLTLFLAGLFLTVSAAATDSLLLFCGYLEEKGEPLLAAHEYGRYLSLSMDFQETIRLKQAAAFEKAGERQSARRGFETVLDDFPGSDQAKLAHFNLVRNAVAGRDYRLARYEWGELGQYALTAADSLERNYLDILIDAHLYRADSVKLKSERLMFSPVRRVQVDSLRTIAAAYQNAEFKFPNFSYTLSGFVPGAGRYYAGDRKTAAGAFLLNTSLAGLMGYCGYQWVTHHGSVRYVAGMDFGVVAFFLFRRYYEGNKKVAYEAAVRHNQEIQRRYQERLIGY
ncbi:MAG: hypothetical protein A2293_14510 [Elusimicrobia bacterium RIFOXYB2_FULL_49_7]|nr:MAG: hypothetical protein A2293_14510 [Elusimicrobia bacterium RIFOXYB2_FULL_49_7]